MGTGDLTNPALVRQAFDMGVNYFDTGEALRNIDRKKVFIACKPTHFDCPPTEEDVLRRVRGSLDRLRTGYVDAYSLYMPTVEGLSYGGYHSAMARLKAEGRV
jgi:aryl-alcohol dehydrogenase-like predicted oxidoreductase